ncbi:MAG: GTP 3',8-cyclase MoaA [Sandaracinus sp.]|nr:GTP 3',8-cyclase MoaA [Sandaracinus sp.]
MRRLPLIESRSAIVEPPVARPAGFAERGIPSLTDRRGRVYRYLRLSVTDRCDLACVYCMPPGGEEDHGLRRELLTFEEAARLIAVFAAGGVERVRFTGGEPLVRKDVVELVERVHRRAPHLRLAMTSNGTRLPELAAPLRAAGLGSVNVSLDALDPDCFAALTRGGDVHRVLAGIEAALAVGMEVKLNAVPLEDGPGTAERLGALVDWAWSRAITPRFIELMPLGEGAALADRRLDAAAVRAMLGDRLSAGEPEAPGGPLGPARYVSGRGGRVGFITAISDEFCASCNRVRVTARGDVRACLADRRALSLRDVMRTGGSDADLAWAMHRALGGKSEGHAFLDPDVVEHEHVGMSLIGG